ncbi:MAG TPA: serine hydrolase domain-containing protein [Acidimicrobiales bacterium]|nr:serine hydrolase domain-containing protein [Acidimicrobiales bacterium]
MTDLGESLPRTTAVIEQGVRDGLHPGAQVYVSLDGKTVADGARGEARDGVPMTIDQMVIWWSMTKASVAVAVAQLWERGRLALDDPVALHVPEFAANGKDRITIRHCLTHTGGFRTGDQALQSGSTSADPDEWWDQTIAAICAVAPEPGWEPGEKAGYHLGCSMSMLGEIVRRVDGRPFSQYVRDEVFLPLGMDDCWVGMPGDAFARYGDRLGTMFNTADGARTPLTALDSEVALSRCSPGGGGRGPMRQLARLYEALAGRGEREGTRILGVQTVEAITARHRVGMYDKTFGVVIDWALGFAVDSGAMGRHCSRRAFGHGGAQSSQAFCDPEYGLVAAVQMNGMCGNTLHYQRLARVWDAMYEDLGLADPSDAGREKPLPSGDTMATA